MTAKIDDDAFVGDQSQVDVRMLTVSAATTSTSPSMEKRPAGGPGDTEVACHHAVQPGSSTHRLHQDHHRGRHTSRQRILGSGCAGVDGTNIEVVSTVIDAGNALMSTVERQRGQVTSILKPLRRVHRSLSAYRDSLRNCQSVDPDPDPGDLRQGVLQTLQGLGDVLLALKTSGGLLRDAPHRIRRRKVRSFLEKGRLFVERNGLIIQGAQAEFRTCSTGAERAERGTGAAGNRSLRARSGERVLMAGMRRALATLTVTAAVIGANIVHDGKPRRGQKFLRDHARQCRPLRRYPVTHLGFPIGKVDAIKRRPRNPYGWTSPSTAVSRSPTTSRRDEVDLHPGGQGARTGR